MKHAWFLHTGYGKTKLMLDTIMSARVKPRVLLISTKQIVESSWQDEIDKWYPNQLTYKYITGSISPNKRKEILQHPTDILAMNTDMLNWYIKETCSKPIEMSVRFNMIIIDESSLFKSYSSKRFKLLKTWCSKCDDVHILSATPVPNSIEDIWSQIYLLDGGKRLGKNITEFRRNYAYEIPMHNGLSRYEYTQEATDIILEKIKDITTSVPEPKEPLFPEPLIKKVLIEPDDKTKELLARFKEDFIIPELDLIAYNKTELMVKINQIASGQMYNDNTIIQINDRKITALKYLLSTINTPVLVLYTYVFDKEQLLKLDGAVLLDSPDKYKAWNRNEIKIGILSPFSAAHGLNLQYSECKDIIWFSPIWDTEKWIQTNARIARRGQTRKVNIRVLLLKNTFDQYAFDLVQDKFKTQYNSLKKLM